jgi:hypothetical protein
LGWRGLFSEQISDAFGDFIRAIGNISAGIADGFDGRGENLMKRAPAQVSRGDAGVVFTQIRQVDVRQ